MTIREDILRQHLSSAPVDAHRELTAIARLCAVLSRCNYIGHMPSLPCVVCDTVDRSIKSHAPSRIGLDRYV
jgi:hypothetical protein